MAKKAKEVELDEEVQIAEVVVLTDETAETALSSINPYRAVIQQIAAECASIEITDRTSLEMAQVAVRRLVKLRTGIDKRRLEMVRPMIDFQKRFKAECDAMVSEIEGIETPIKTKINAEEIRLQEAAKAEHIRRVTLIETAGWVLAGQFYQCGMSRILFDQVDQADEQQLMEWVDIGDAERDRLAAIAVAEQQRVEAMVRQAQELSEREAALTAKLARLEDLERQEAARNEPVLPPADLFADSGIPNVAPPIVVWGTPPAHAINIHAPVQLRAAPDPAPEVVTHPAFRLGYNAAIDDILEQFTTQSMDKPLWIGLFRSMKM